jgi:pimeloyl-ACP methyl ester carboxylesterase
MLKKSFMFLWCAFALFAEKGQMAHVNQVDIYYETFGQKKNPAVLLIMGACCQSVIWHKDFCERLANEGFYVIRYDHRDAGLSTCFDFEQHPYDLMDMANDAIGVLDAAGVDNAHLFGVSMGSFIAELMAVRFPKRINSLLLLGSTCEIRPMNLALSGAPAEESCSFSSPTDEYLDWMKEFTKLSAQTDAEKLDLRVKGWDRLNGQKIPLNAEKNRDMQKTFLARLRYPQGIVNHLTMLSNESSEAIVRSIPSRVTVPTIIISGSEDPIYPPDHGEALAGMIEHSEYILLDGMGHIPNDHFYDLYISIIKRQALIGRKVPTTDLSSLRSSKQHMKHQICYKMSNDRRP